MPSPLQLTFLRHSRPRQSLRLVAKYVLACEPRCQQQQQKITGLRVLHSKIRHSPDAALSRSPILLLFYFDDFLINFTRGAPNTTLAF